MGLPDIEEDPPVPSDDETLTGHIDSRRDDRINVRDWSQTGRGSHVDFEYKDIVPLEQGRFLGQGAIGNVYETRVQGWKLAHKRIMVSRKISDKDKKEIEILKRLSSQNHMIQLVGTYTHRRLLGILLYPVATCDLQTFFVDIEAWSSLNADATTRQTHLDAFEPDHKERLAALGYDFPEAASRLKASPVYRMMGGLISAIAYLHEQKIRHKDLKPSNILLSRERLWLSDFGSATDFSLLSQSATDNERGGTPRYFSPEVAARQENGRASDIFSLGCVLLEIIVLHDKGTREHIREQCSSDQSFHANLDQVDTWCASHKRRTRYPRRFYYLQHIKTMLRKDPKARPTAEQLLVRFIGYDYGGQNKLRSTIFGDCCRRVIIPERSLEEERRTARELLSDANHKRHEAEEVLREEQAKVHELREAMESMYAVQVFLQDEQRKASELQKDLRASLEEEQERNRGVQADLRASRAQFSLLEVQMEELQRNAFDLRDDLCVSLEEEQEKIRGVQADLRTSRTQCSLLQVNKKRLQEEAEMAQQAYAQEHEQMRNQSDHLRQQLQVERRQYEEIRSQHEAEKAEILQEKSTQFEASRSRELYLEHQIKALLSEVEHLQQAAARQRGPPLLPPVSGVTDYRRKDATGKATSIPMVQDSSQQRKESPVNHLRDVNMLPSASSFASQRLPENNAGPFYFWDKDSKTLTRSVNRDPYVNPYVQDDVANARTLQAPRAASSSSTNSASPNVEARDSRLDRQLTGFAEADGIDASFRNAKPTGGKVTAVRKQKVPPSSPTRQPMPRTDPYSSLSPPPFSPTRSVPPKSKGFLAQFIDKVKESGQPPTEKWLRERK